MHYDMEIFVTDGVRIKALADTCACNEVQAGACPSSEAQANACTISEVKVDACVSIIFNHQINKSLNQ